MIRRKPTKDEIQHETHISWRTNSDVLRLVKEGKVKLDARGVPADPDLAWRYAEERVRQAEKNRGNARRLRPNKVSKAIDKALAKNPKAAAKAIIAELPRKTTKGLTVEQLSDRIYRAKRRAAARPPRADYYQR